jgi:hypothetical protein
VVAAVNRGGASRFNDKHNRHVPPPSNCQTRKAGYKKKRQAKLAADRLRRQDINRSERAIYRCEFCGLYHITSHSGAVPRRQAA